MGCKQTASVLMPILNDLSAALGLSSEAPIDESAAAVEVYLESDPSYADINQKRRNKTRLAFHDPEMRNKKDVTGSLMKPIDHGINGLFQRSGWLNQLSNCTKPDISAELQKKI
jgi:hypothetical protein